MINGVPPLVSDRFNAVCALWDDAGLYKAASERAREIAGDRYGESVSRRKHLDYFTSLVPGGRPVCGANAY